MIEQVRNLHDDANDLRTPECTRSAHQDQFIDDAYQRLSERLAQVAHKCLMEPHLCERCASTLVKMNWFQEVAAAFAPADTSKAEHEAQLANRDKRIRDLESRVSQLISEKKELGEALGRSR